MAMGTSAAGPHRDQLLTEALVLSDSLAIVDSRIDVAIQENERWTAIALAVALGPFGGHRLYMGTGAKVPIIYTLTLGGGFGVLPTIDLVHLLLKKDLAPYRNNRQVFMWVPPDREKATPP
jgi:hypothetical protein